MDQHMFSFKYADLVEFFNFNNFNEVVVNYAGKELQVTRKGNKFDFFIGVNVKAQIFWVGNKKLAFTGMIDSSSIPYDQKAFLVNKVMMDNGIKPDVSLDENHKLSVSNESFEYKNPVLFIRPELSTMTSEELRELARSAVAELDKRQSTINVFLIELER